MSRSNRSEADINRQLALTPAGPRRPYVKEKEMDRLFNLRNALVFFALLAGVMVLGHYEKETTDADMRQYCRLVALNRASGGELGWPDYNHVFSQQCTPSGQLQANAGG